MPRRQEAYDAIVVGSGITGGWAAKELCEAGLNVLMLEAGREIVPERDYTEHTPIWEFEYRGLGDRAWTAANQPVQSKAGPVNETTREWFVNDHENPYVQPEDKPFLWIRGRHLGGRSIMWGRQSYRLSDLDFEANAKDGFGTDWPIRYADLAPWYDHVEAFAGISGQAERLAHLPDGRFLPPMELTCAESHVRERVLAAYGDRTLTIGRTAVLTQDHMGRRACHYCGPCSRGCRTRSYFSTLNATLPVARATGNLTLRVNSVVERVLFDMETNRATGVRVIDRETMEDMEFQGRIVFLCASALESTRLLLNSSNSRHPYGLGNSSGQLGRNLMDHNMGAGARGRFPQFNDHDTFGARPNGIYMIRFRNVTDQHPDFLRGYAYQGGASREGWSRAMREPGFGADLKRRLHDAGDWRMSLYGFGACLPRPENYVELDPDGAVDAWGIPALKIHCAWSDNELNMRKDMQVQAAEMLEASGATDIEMFDDGALPGEAIHEMGTARMSTNPREGVLNGYCQSWDVPNLFVPDGAAMGSSANQNPSLTYMALTARAAAYAVEQLKRGDL